MSPLEILFIASLRRSSMLWLQLWFLQRLDRVRLCLVVLTKYFRCLARICSSIYLFAPRIP